MTPNALFSSPTSNRNKEMQVSISYILIFIFIFYNLKKEKHTPQAHSITHKNFINIKSRVLLHSIDFVLRQHDLVVVGQPRDAGVDAGLVDAGGI